MEKVYKYDEMSLNSKGIKRYVPRGQSIVKRDGNPPKEAEKVFLKLFGILLFVCLFCLPVVTSLDPENGAPEALWIFH